jgi:hypothetical protein
VLAHRAFRLSCCRASRAKEVHRSRRRDCKSAIIAPTAGGRINRYTGSIDCLQLGEAGDLATKSVPACVDVSSRTECDEGSTFRPCAVFELDRHRTNGRDLMPDACLICFPSWSSVFVHQALRRSCRRLSRQKRVHGSHAAMPKVQLLHRRPQGASINKASRLLAILGSRKSCRQVGLGK